MMFTMLLRKIAIPIAVFAALIFAAPTPSHAQVVISVGFAPPILPVYAQPPIPGDGYIWTPGYWAYGPEGYYWIPGTWVLAPTPGFLWTPAYWGWEGGFYRFHGGYWGPHVGFYGGINYGFGYTGIGFEGGYWNSGHFFYNSAFNRFGEGFHPTNVYVHNVTVINNTHVSFNGGNGGVQARPTPAESQAMHENHVQPTPMQQQHFQAAAQDRGQLASVNGGRPQMAAARTPKEFSQHVNSLPQTQRVAAGAPGARVSAANGQPHPAGQSAARPAAAPVTRPTTAGQPAARPAAAPVTRPAPAARTAPEARPAPQSRPAPQPAARPAPQSHPAPAAHEERPRL